VQSKTDPNFVPFFKKEGNNFKALNFDQALKEWKEKFKTFKPKEMIKEQKKEIAYKIWILDQQGNVLKSLIFRCYKKNEMIHKAASLAMDIKNAYSFNSQLINLK